MNHSVLQVRPLTPGSTNHQFLQIVNSLRLRVKAKRHNVTLRKWYPPCKNGWGVGFLWTNVRIVP